MPSPTFTRPASDAEPADLRRRLRGLTPTQVVLMRKLMRLHAAGDRPGFALDLMQLRTQAPDHPEVLLWLGVLHMESHAWPEAVEALSRAAAQRSDDLEV